MHEIKQEKDRCLHACVASIMEIPSSEVPALSIFDGGWHEQLKAWLRERNMSCAVVACDETLSSPDGYAVLIQELDGGAHHAVVAKDGISVWDPRGTQPMQEKPIAWVVFTVLDPSKRLATTDAAS